MSIWWFVLIIVFLWLLRTAWFKGKAGEFKVNLSADLRLDKSKYLIFKDVTLPTDDGTTQIDHIIVSQYGVFVIETKNYKGWIFGDANQKTWTQVLYKKKSKFPNPLHQNYIHVKVLKELLGLTNAQIFNVVTFVGDSKFKTDMPENVTQGSRYIKFIKSKTDTVLSENQVQEIVEKITSGRLERSFKTNREHVQNVKKKLHHKKHGTDCPKCGSEMILRTAKQGVNAGQQFYGCSRYPKCRGTRPA